ncbi:MAG: tetratricopeptide repeat protein, partial [Promethearchaeota archaeon]
DNLERDLKFSYLQICLNYASTKKLPVRTFEKHLESMIKNELDDRITLNLMKNIASSNESLKSKIQAYFKRLFEEGNSNFYNFLTTSEITPESIIWALLFEDKDILKEFIKKWGLYHLKYEKIKNFFNLPGSPSFELTIQSYLEEWVSHQDNIDFNNNKVISFIENLVKDDKISIIQNFIENNLENLTANDIVSLEQKGFSKLITSMIKNLLHEIDYSTYQKIQEEAKLAENIDEINKIYKKYRKIPKINSEISKKLLNLLIKLDPKIPEHSTIIMKILSPISLISTMGPLHDLYYSLLEKVFLNSPNYEDKINVIYIFSANLPSFYINKPQKNTLKFLLPNYDYYDDKRKKDLKFYDFPLNLKLKMLKLILKSSDVIRDFMDFILDVYLFENLPKKIERKLKTALLKGVDLKLLENLFDYIDQIEFQKLRFLCAILFKMLRDVGPDDFGEFGQRFISINKIEKRKTAISLLLTLNNDDYEKILSPFQSELEILLQNETNAEIALQLLLMLRKLLCSKLSETPIYEFSKKELLKILYFIGEAWLNDPIFLLKSEEFNRIISNSNKIEPKRLKLIKKLSLNKDLNFLTIGCNLFLKLSKNIIENQEFLKQFDLTLNNIVFPRLKYGIDNIRTIELDAIFNALKVISPEKAHTWLLYGLYCYSKLENIDETPLYFEKAMNLSHNDDEIYDVIATNYYEYEEFEEAINIWKKALVINSNNPKTHAKIAQTQAELNQIENSLENYAKAREINPNMWEAWFNPALILGERGDLEEARTLLERAKKIVPIWEQDSYIKVLDVLGRLYINLGEYQNAEKIYREIIPLRDTSSFRLNFSVALISNGKIEDGMLFLEDTLNEISEDDENYENFLANLIFTYFYMGPEFIEKCIKIILKLEESNADRLKEIIYQIKNEESFQKYLEYHKFKEIVDKYI